MVSALNEARKFICHYTKKLRNQNIKKFWFLNFFKIILSTKTIPKAAKNMTNWTILVKVGKKKYADFLLKMNSFLEMKIKA